MSSVMFAVRRRDLAWAVALVVLLSAVWVAQSDVADAGGSPPGEGIAVVYVAVGTNFPDALGVGPGAGADSGPIIILPKDPPIPASSSAELVRLDPRTLVIVGGTGVISAAMETALGVLLPNAAISRIAGANRYDTNAAFSAATFPIEGWASIPPSAFHAQNPQLENVVRYTDLAYNDLGGALYAPIQLPHGAEILELSAVANDDGESPAITVEVIRNSSLCSCTDQVAVVSTTPSGLPETVSTSTITPGTEIVDNGKYAYLVVVSNTSAASGWVANVMVRYRLGVSTG